MTFQRRLSTGGNIRIRGRPVTGLRLQRASQNRKTMTIIHALRWIQTHNPSIPGAKIHTLNRAASVIGTVHYQDDKIKKYVDGDVESTDRWKMHKYIVQKPKWGSAL